MADAEMEFGDVALPQQVSCLRPDRNKQYAVVACGTVSDADLPVFVDLDALRDMEWHALSDTGVELGGILLGGQYVDPSGRPFVVVADSLRARHYESTRGSFKFTHDTWSEITRERDEFPPDLQMVGWYHTHPDWGVFLSGMDLFICDHFFNRPLDVALVIDPCRGDRGWFQWTGNPGNRIRRIGGFHIFASRHRGQELAWFAAQLGGQQMMSHEPRAASIPMTGGPYPAPVVHVAESRSPWPWVAAIALAGMQFLLAAVLIWKVLLLPEDAASPGQTAAEKSLLERLDRLAAGELTDRDFASQRSMLDQVVEALGDGSTSGVVRLLEQARQEQDRLEADARVYRDLEHRVKLENERLLTALDVTQSEKRELSLRVDNLQKRLANEESRVKDFEQELARLAKSPAGDAGDATAGQLFRWSDVPAWGWSLAGFLLGAAATLGVVAVRWRQEGSSWPGDGEERGDQEGKSS